MVSVDDAIQQVERLYVSITGREPPKPNGVYAAIPPERDPVEYVEAAMLRLEAALNAGQGVQAAAAEPVFVPRVDLHESDAEYIVIADLPGVERDHVQVTVLGRAIVVHGERNGTGASATSVRHAECRRGRFLRQIMLGTPVRAEEAVARLRDGVLEVHLPKGAPAPDAPTRRSVPVG